MQVREQRVGADMGEPEFSDGRRRYGHRDGAQDQAASRFEASPALAARSVLERLNGMDHNAWLEWTRGTCGAVGSLGGLP